MIVVLIAGVLLLVAYPSYLDSVRKSRRSEAFTALAAVQQAQERWRSNHAAYTTSLADLGLSASTPSNYYAVSIAAAPASAPLTSAYVATAVGKAGSSQASDSQCRRLSVQLNGGNLSYAGCGSCASFTYTATHACWAR
jgi:type IV pilus assembly protein PilE